MHGLLFSLMGAVALSVSAEENRLCLFHAYTGARVWLDNQEVEVMRAKLNAQGFGRLCDVEPVLRFYQ